MRAIEYSRTGSTDVLHLVDRPVTPPGPGEVLVRIAVSGVNPTDWKARAGNGDGAQLPHAQVPGQDGAGVIEQLGEGVEGLSIGQRVWVWDAAYQRADGTAQELALVPADQTVPLDDRVSYDVGASLGIPALTAHRALTAREDGPHELAPGSLAGATVLVAGGAGAVGHAAIQLARWAGARVLATVSSPRKAELASAAGADHVINYRTEDVAARVLAVAADGVDVVVEVDATKNLALDLQVLRVGGTISMYAGGIADEAGISIRGAMTRNARLQFILTYTTTPSQKRAAVRAVTAAAGAGALGVGIETGLPLTRFALEQLPEAHRAVENNAIGKVLVDVESA